MTIRILNCDELDECAVIREAARGCLTVLAAPATVEQARKVIKVIAGSEVEQLVISVPGDQAALDAYARGLGIAPVFVDAEFIQEFEEKRCRAATRATFGAPVSSPAPRQGASERSGEDTGAPK